MSSTVFLNTMRSAAVGLGLLLGLTACWASSMTSLPIRVGISTGAHPYSHRFVFDTSVQALRQHFGKENIVFTYLTMGEMDEAVKNGRVHFIISTSGSARRLMGSGTTPLITIISDRFPDPNNSFGATFFTQEDSPIRSIADMQGKDLVAVRSLGFFGYLVGLGEIRRQGYDEKTFFGKKTFLQTEESQVIFDVQRRRSEVGILPSCYLEDVYGEDFAQKLHLRVIGAKTGKGPCQVSSDQYPNWSLSVLPGTAPSLAKEVMTVLINLQGGDKGYAWTVTTDFSSTDRLLRELQQGVYIYLRHWDVLEFFKQYREWIVLVLLLLTGLIWHSTILRIQIKKRAAALKQAFERESGLIAQTSETERRYASLQRAGSIGQMGSMISHELRYPLSSISAYTHGVSRFIETDNISKGELLETTRKIGEQAEKCEAIIEKIRSYARSSQTGREYRNLNAMVKRVVSSFMVSSRFGGKVDVFEGSVVHGYVVQIEFELVLQNLLRNAAQALKKARVVQPKISISIDQNDESIWLLVSDNGPKLSPEELERIQTPVSVGQDYSEGLGLLVSESIVVNHGGKMTLEANPQGGLCVRVIVPKLEETQPTGWQDKTSDSTGV